MSKAIEGAALIGLAVGMLALAFFDPAILLVPGYVQLFDAALFGGIALEAGAIAQALTQNRGMGITTRQPAAFRQIIYGTQRVGGIIVYQSTTGSKHDQYNFIIVLAGHEVDAIVNLYLDGRQVFWDTSDYGNTTRNGVNFGGSADGNDHIGPTGTHYNFGGLVYCEARFGDQLDGDVIGAMTANDPVWAAGASGSPWLGGCTYVYLKVEYNTGLFPSLPEARFTIQGKNNIFDPRTNTRGYTENWALIVADVLTDPVFGLGDPSVNQAQLIAAANVCDEQVELAAGATDVNPSGTEARYTCHYHYDASTGPGDVLAQMMLAAAARLSRVGGEWYLWPSYWQAPSFAFDENALVDKLQWNPYRSYRDLWNYVSGTYVAPNYPYNAAGNLYDSNGWYYGTTQNNFPFAFQPTNYPQYAQDQLHGYSTNANLNADSGATSTWSDAVTYADGDVVLYDEDIFQSIQAGNLNNIPSAADSAWWAPYGVILPHETGQPCVLSIAQAQRCAKIFYMRNRQQGSGALSMSLAAYQAVPLDVLLFTFPAIGWSAKALEITGLRLKIEGGHNGGEDGEEASAPRLYVQLEVIETAESTYEWDAATEELNVYDVPGMPASAPYTPDAPTSLSATSSNTTALTNTDGIVTPRALLSWTAPTDVTARYVQIQYALTGTGAWIDAGVVDASSISAYVGGLITGSAYDFQIRSIRNGGAQSAWVQVIDIMVSADASTVPGMGVASSALSTGILIPDTTNGHTYRIQMIDGVLTETEV